MPAEWQKVYRASVRISGDISMYKRTCINLRRLRRGLDPISAAGAAALLPRLGAPSFPFPGTAGGFTLCSAAPSRPKKPLARPLNINYSALLRGVIILLYMRQGNT